jgi:hypothetical protein
MAIEVAGPEELTVAEIVGAYRRWLGLRPARMQPLPKWLQSLAFRLGDLAGLLGWRPPIRSNAAREMVRGATGDPTRWMELTGIRPRKLSEALQSEPASVQERWFAQLYFLKPVVFVVFSAFWILTGLISLGPGWEIGKSLMAEAGMGPLGPPGIVVGALVDILVGLAVAFRRTSRLGLYAALAVSAFYVVTGTLLVPRLWADPVGPMLKIWPVIALNLVALAILDDR